MDALVLEQPTSLSLKEVPVPEPGDGEILLQVKTATTCGTDLKAFLRGHPQIPMPGVLGHEYSGVVASAGPGAKFSEGDEIMGVHSAPCQDCFYCHAGQENLCESIMGTKVLGSYAKYLLIPKRIVNLNVFHKPASISFNRASLLEPLACVAQGLSEVPFQVTDRVLIIGPGAIGLMFVAALRAAGLHDITLLGRNPARLEVGEQLGARPAVADDLALRLGRGFDLVIECTGKIDVWEQSIHYARRGGRVMLFGGCPAGSMASFDTKKLHYDQITLYSPFHFGSQAVRQARQWLLDPEIPFEALISGERPLSAGTQVFADLKAGVGIKYAFKP